MGIFDHRSNSGLLHEHIRDKHEHVRDEYDHNASDDWSDYCSDCWTATGYASSNAKFYGGPLDFTPSRSASVGCGMTRRIMQSATQMHSSRSHDAVIRVYDDADNVIETHEHRGDFQRVLSARRRRIWTIFWQPRDCPDPILVLGRRIFSRAETILSRSV